jgi:hypothetical protein
MPDADTSSLCQQLTAFTPEAITTVYLQYDPATRLDLPFYALLDDPGSHQYGQFVFDRGQLDAAQAGLLAVVISASGPASAQPQELLAEAVAVQLAVVFQRPELGRPAWFKVITEKRATYASTLAWCGRTTPAACRGWFWPATTPPATTRPRWKWRSAAASLPPGY